MKHLDLFSGIGGFAVAASQVGWTIVGLCEVDSFCIRVLRRRIDCDRWFSLPEHFGGREARGPYGSEIIAGIAPDWIVLENSYHTWRRWMPELRRHLWGRGYASLPLRVRASEVGAIHHRARGWLVANHDCEQLRKLSGWWRREGRQVAQELAESWDSAPRGLGADDGLPDWVDRRKALGNAIVPQCAELIFRGIERVSSV